MSPSSASPTRGPSSSLCGLGASREPAGLGPLEPARGYEALDELRREEPAPGEPATDLRLGRDDRGAHCRDEELLGPAGPARRLRERLVPPLEHAVPPHDGAAELEREEDCLQLLRLQVELDLQVLGRRRARGEEVVEDACPLGRVRPHALDLRAADRVEERRRLLGYEQVLAAVVDLEPVDTVAVGELAEPRPLGRRPLAEAAAAGRVRILVAGLVEGPERRGSPPRTGATGTGEP